MENSINSSLTEAEVIFDGNITAVESIQSINLSENNPLIALLPQDFDPIKPLASKTFTIPAFDWKLKNSDTVFANMGTTTVGLIKIPLVNAPFFRLYSTLSTTVTSRGWRTRPFRGGRNPQAGGFLSYDLDFKTSSRAYLDGWNGTFSLRCDDSNRSFTPISNNFASDFYDEVQILSWVYSGKFLVRC